MIVPIFTFDQAWATMAHLFIQWLVWAQNWTVGLSALDWQNFTQIMHDQWIVDVAGTGWKWAVVWQLIEAFFATIGAGVGIFVWWILAHIAYPWAGFFLLGIFCPLAVGFGYLMYIATIYIIVPALFVLVIENLLSGKWWSKVVYFTIWCYYTYLLISHTPKIILISPGWYLLITMLLAISLRGSEISTAKTSS